MSSSEHSIPKGYFNKLEDYIKFNSYRHVSYYREIYPEQPLPIHIKNNVLHGSWWTPECYERGFVIVLNDCKVYGERGTIITSDNKVIHEYSFEWVYQSPEEHTIFRKHKLEPVSGEYENVAILTNPWILNYYHWILEVLPRIHLLEESGLQIHKYIVNNPFQHEMLGKFGIPFDKVIVPNDNTHLKIKNLIIPSQLTLPNKWACDYVRGKLLPEKINSNKNNKKIYITRTNKRLVKNEDAIFGFLQKEGFERVQLENFNLVEQVKLLSESEFVIGPHGAGLTNLLFCNPGTKVLELLPITYVQPYFWILSDLINLDYHYLLEDTIQVGWPGFHDIVVNENRFYITYENIKTKN